MADKDAEGRPQGRARPASRGTRQTLAFATITLVVPIAVALVLLAESEAGLVRIAFFNLHPTEPRGALAVGFGLGLTLAMTAVLARFVARRRVSGSLVCLPPAFAAAVTLATTIAFLPDPLAPAPDLAFGDRARAAAFALMIRAALFDASLFVSAISLGAAALALRPFYDGGLAQQELRSAPQPPRATESFTTDKRPFAALVVAAITLPGAAYLASLGRPDLGRNAFGSWIAALPAGMGLVAVVLGASRTRPGDDRAAARLLAAACAGIGGVLLAALAPAMGQVLWVSTPDTRINVLAAVAKEIQSSSRTLAALGALFALPLVLTTLVALPRGALRGALSRARPTVIFAILLALAPALFLVPTSVALDHIESLAQDQRRLFANPGVTLSDASLPAGTLVVDLAGAFAPDLDPDLVPSKPTFIVLGADARSKRWEEGALVQFEGLGEGTHELRLDGPYLAPILRVSMPNPRIGARIVVPAIPLAPPLLGPPEPIDAAAPDTFVREGSRR